jgi:hypothetical protein
MVLVLVDWVLCAVHEAISLYRVWSIQVCIYSHMRLLIYAIKIISIKQKVLIMQTRIPVLCLKHINVCGILDSQSDDCEEFYLL